jgi:hypothetical protein
MSKSTPFVTAGQEFVIVGQTHKTAAPCAVVRGNVKKIFECRTFFVVFRWVLPGAVFYCSLVGEKYTCIIKTIIICAAKALPGR